MTLLKKIMTPLHVFSLHAFHILILIFRYKFQLVIIGHFFKSLARIFGKTAMRRTKQTKNEAS